jgi:chemotaxis protein CheC
MQDVRNLSARQLDALREVANIGAGHAATALSQMTDETIMISTPRLAMSGVAELPVLLGASAEPVAAVLLRMVGDLKGLSVLTFSHSSAMRLAELMSRRPAGTCKEVGAFEQSAIQEAGNILSSAYLNALAEFMGMVLLPTPPDLAVGLSHAALADAVRASSGAAAVVFVMETEFFLKDRDEPLRGLYFMLPDAESLDLILHAVRLG